MNFSIKAASFFIKTKDFIVDILLPVFAYVLLSIVIIFISILLALGGKELLTKYVKPIVIESFCK